LHKTSRFGDVLINTAKVIFETHGLFCASGIPEVPDCRLIEASMGYLSWGHAVLCGGFDRLPGVMILELCRA